MEPNNQSSKNIDNLISMVNQKLVISSNPGNGSSVVEAEPGAIDLDQLYAEISLLRGANRVLADCLSRKTGVPFKTVTDSAFRVVLATRESNVSDDIYGRRLLPSYNESPSSYVDNDAMLKQLLMQIKIRDEMFLKLASEADVQPSLFPARRFLTRLIASHVEFFDFHSVLDQIRLMNHRTYLSMITRPNGSDFGNYVVQNQLQLERDDQSRRPNKVVQFAKDARGSEVLKRGIKEGFSNEDIKVIFEEIKDDLIHLSMDSNGKFVVGELLSVINGEKFGQVFYHVLLPELENLCYHIHGTYVALKLVDCVKERDQITQMFMVLTPPLIQLMQSGCATHVIDVCLAKFPTESNQFFLDKVAVNCEVLAKDKQGCRLLQKCLDCADQYRKYKLMDEIIKKASCLTRDQYGNYVVQRALDMNMPNVPNCIVEELKGDFVSLSKQQCGSNVVERILMRASREKVREIVNEIVEDPSVLALYQDQFGNYVIQKALQVTFKWPDIFDAVAKVVEENYSTLDTHMYGKRIVSCWAKMQNERRSNRLMASLDAQSNF